MNHLAFGLAKDRDLKGLLDWDQATVIATTTHHSRSCGRRHWLRERRRSRAVVVLGFVGGRIVATDCRVCVAAVGVKIARDLSVNGVCC